MGVNGELAEMTCSPSTWFCSIFVSKEKYQDSAPAGVAPWLNGSSVPRGHRFNSRSAHWNSIVIYFYDYVALHTRLERGSPLSSQPVVGRALGGPSWGDARGRWSGCALMASRAGGPGTSETSLEGC